MKIPCRRFGKIYQPIVFNIVRSRLQQRSYIKPVMNKSTDLEINFIMTAEGINSSDRNANNNVKKPIRDCLEKTWYPLKNLYKSISPIKKSVSLKVKLEEAGAENAMIKEENKKISPANLLFKKTTKR